MRKSGTVAQINRDRCMVAIATDIGYTIIEVTPEWELDIGDRLAWEDGLHIGLTIYENLTRACATASSSETTASPVTRLRISCCAESRVHKKGPPGWNRRASGVT